MRFSNTDDASGASQSASRSIRSEPLADGHGLFQGMQLRLSRLSLSVFLTLAVSALFGWHLLRAHAQAAAQMGRPDVPFNYAPINYSSDARDPVAKLQERLIAGKAKLEYEPQYGYLRSALKLLDVPIDSQTLVFSKTSFQYSKISPEHPRALYFNDDVYVGRVHDGKGLEFVSFDPKQGAIFYLLDEHKAAHPSFKREDLDCTQCHVAASTRGVPGVFLRSVYTADTGLPAGGKSYVTDQESPLKDRWGGWYVTGRFNGFNHMGNAVVDAKGTQKFDLVGLSKTFDKSDYLIPDSDIVAHLVLAHQTQMHNLITLTNYRTRIALYAQAQQNKRAGLPEDAPLSDAARKQFERPAEQLLRYMLFSNEAPLPGQLIASSSSYEKEFVARGPTDPKGRSLRDFDLKTGIFRYPCSYLIYSGSFDSIPEPAKEYVYHRLFEVLTGKDQSPDFVRLSGDDRKAILEILLATKPGLPEEWRDYAKSNRIHVAANRSRPHPEG